MNRPGANRCYLDAVRTGVSAGLAAGLYSRHRRTVLVL